jgi:ABC-type ATPase involved in cell division
VLGALIPALRRSSLTVTADDFGPDAGAGRGLAASSSERRGVNRPAVLLADEPAGSVDTATCEETS